MAFTTTSWLECLADSFVTTIRCRTGAMNVYLISNTFAGIAVVFTAGYVTVYSVNLVHGFLPRNHFYLSLYWLDNSIHLILIFIRRDFLALFAIADLHLALSVNKPMDIFGGWDNYMERLQENWQKNIKPEDTVVIAGDISWIMKLSEGKKDFEFINNLNGRKIILKGNHDYWWTSLTKIRNFFNENGFDSIELLHMNHYKYENIGICGTRGWVNEPNQTAEKKVLDREAMRLEQSILSALKENLQPIVFLHYPPIYLASRTAEIMEVLHKYDIKNVFYGHLHGGCIKNAKKGLYEGINFQLISGDYLQFNPIDITDTVQNAENKQKY